MRQYIEKLINKQSLTIDEMKEATNNCFHENITDAEIAAFLIALRSKGETAEEMTGIAEVIRAQSELNTITQPNIMDNCGTGGDGSQSFNISTTASFVIAGAGVTIAKHGNRSISSKTGSADVLENLGVSLSFTKEQVEQLLVENKIAFLFAPHVHAKLKHFMKIRKELGLPTIFNTIGPLTNPVQLDSQLLGVYRRDMTDTIAKALNQLGRKRAVVINGAGHMDEASLAGENHLVLLEDGERKSFTIKPSDVHLPTYDNDVIRGGDAKENATILLSVLNGEKGPHRDTILLNAGIGLFANGKVSTIIDGIELAKESIDSGKAHKRLQYLIDFSNKIAKEVV